MEDRYWKLELRYDYKKHDMGETDGELTLALGPSSGSGAAVGEDMEPIRDMYWWTDSQEKVEALHHDLLIKVDLDCKLSSVKLTCHKKSDSSLISTWDPSSQTWVPAPEAVRS